MTAHYKLDPERGAQLVLGVVPSNLRIEMLQGQLVLRLYGLDGAVQDATCGTLPPGVPEQTVWHFAAYRIEATARGGKVAEFKVTIQRA